MEQSHFVQATDIKPEITHSPTSLDIKASNSMIRAQRFKLPSVVVSSIIKNSNRATKEESSTNLKATSTKSIDGAINTISKIVRRMSSNKKSNFQMTCQICLKDAPSELLKSMSSCSHKFCQSCLHQYIIYKVKSFQEVQCPNDACENLIDVNGSVFNELPMDIQKKYNKIRQYEISKNPNKRLCPNEHCEGVLNLNNEDYNLHIDCQSCKTTFCRKCFFIKHEGDCDPFQVEFFEKNMNYRQCSQCKNVIEKISGCNHITCKCSYEFCYVCGGKWAHDHLCSPNTNENNNENNEQNQQLFAVGDICECLKKSLLTVMLLLVSPILYIVLLIIVLILILSTILAGLTYYTFQIIYQQYSTARRIIKIMFLPITIVYGLKQSVMSIFWPMVRDHGYQSLFILCLMTQHIWNA